MGVSSISSSAGASSVGSTGEVEDITDPTEEDPADNDAQITDMVQNGTASSLYALYSGSNAGTAPSCEEILQALTGQAPTSSAPATTPGSTYANTPSTSPSSSASATMSAMTQSSL